jgi:hypothetical protein
MAVRLLRAAAVTAWLVIAAACGGSDSTSAPGVTLTAPRNGGTAYVEITGLSGAALDAIDDADYTPEQWAALLRVAVDPDAPPMLGSYAVANRAVRFTPAFPFDPGRQYHVRFDVSRVPGSGEEAIPPLVATVGLPASTRQPSTVVTRIYPSGDVVPENLLRMYVEFSAPMGRRSGVEFMKLLNSAGAEIPGAILPLDYEFWSPDHKRFTVFFDPGRVKDGILPNRQMGRPLSDGGSMTFVISREWPDGNGLPLKEEYRRTFRVAGADTNPIDTAAWKIQAPSAGERNPVVVMFPEPLDHGLLLRALGVNRNGMPVAGDIAVDSSETRWMFTPEMPWRAGHYELLALDILEDLAGNQIGRAFEVDNFDTVDKSPNPQTIRLPFVVRQ